MRLLLSTFALVTLAAAHASAEAAGLTVKPGETWVFSIEGGQPAHTRKVIGTTKASPGQVLVTVKSMMGTTMTITSNNKQAYTYKAELIGADKTAPARSCTLPANNRLSFENWPQKATAVRLSDFKVATKDGACP